MKMQANDPREMEPATSAWLANMTLDEYHQADHDSSSTIRQFAESPFFYDCASKGLVEFKKTDSLRLGNVAHVVFTEYEKRDQRLAIKPSELCSPDGGLRSDAAKAWKKEQEAAGRVIASQQELTEALLMREAAMANKDCRRVLELASIHEQSIFWTTVSHKLKVRIDLGLEIDWEIYDVKRVSETFDRFWYSVGDYGYDAQAALYVDGFEAYYGVKPRFFWLMVSPNLRCRIEECPPGVLEAGRMKNIKALTELAECRAGVRPWLREDDLGVRMLDAPPHMYAAEPNNYEGI